MNRFFIALLASASVAAVSCSDDDEPKVPSNAITVNMMAVNSETTIGESDVYINASNNFTTARYAIADLGKTGGFDRFPNLSQLAQEVAVTPGNFYQIVLAEDIRTVAGARAIPANSGFYNAYVDSWIYDKNSDISGAKVSYAECIPETDRLPEWNSKIEVTMSPDRKDENVESAVYSFPRGCEIDESVEVNNINGYNNLKQHLDIDVDDNRISFSNTAWTGGARAEVVLLVRYESVYSRVVLEVQSSM